MKNQLLNLKMIALMCLMMVLGGANVWAEDVTYTHTFKNGDLLYSQDNYFVCLNSINEIATLFNSNDSSKPGAFTFKSSRLSFRKSN